MICSVRVCTYSFAAGGVQFLDRSGAGVPAAVCVAWMGEAVEIQRAIANALLRRMAILFIEHLILWELTSAPRQHHAPEPHASKVTLQPEWNLNGRHKHADSRLSAWRYSGNCILASTASNLGPPVC